MGIYLVPQRKEDEPNFNGARSATHDGGRLMATVNPTEFVGHSIVFNPNDARDRGIITQASAEGEELRLGYRKTKKALTDPGQEGQITLRWGDLIPYEGFSFCLLDPTTGVRICYQNPAKPRRNPLPAAPGAETKAEVALTKTTEQFILTGMNSGLFLGNVISSGEGLIKGKIQKVEIPLGKSSAIVTWEEGSIGFALKDLKKGPKPNTAVVMVSGVMFTLHHNRPTLSFSALAMSSTPRPASAATPWIPIQKAPSVPPAEVPPPKD